MKEYLKKEVGQAKVLEEEGGRGKQAVVGIG